MTTNMELLAHHVEHWAKERGLDNPENSTAQALKLFEEAGELAQAHLKKRDDEGKDAVGDILVVLTIYRQQKGWSIAECFQMAWNEIKDRKGKMVDGSVEGVNYVEVVKGEACFEFGQTRYPESSLFIHMEDEHLSFAELIKDKDFEFKIIGNIYENPELLEYKE